MNCLMFLFVRGAINRLLELRRKPAMLTLYILLVLFIVFIIIIMSMAPPNTLPRTDIAYLRGIIFAYFTIIFIFSIVEGLSQGSALFGMEDVNLLFVAPVNPRSILLYGFVRTAKTLILTSLLILFQGPNLRGFGVDTGGLFILYGGYLLTAFVFQILSLLIYSLTNNRHNRQTFVKILIVLIFAPLIFIALLRLFQSGGDVAFALKSVLSSSILSYTPIVGWAQAWIIAFIQNDMAAGALYLGLLFLTGAISIAFIYYGVPDYYEDVLVASVTMFERKRAFAEGKINALEHSIGKEIKVKATGIGGLGASAFFHKHIRESFRANRFGLWGAPTVITVIGATLFTLFMRQTVSGPDTLEAASNISMLGALFMLMYIQIFFVGTGRGLKETYVHYIYMTPDDPFIKMMWSNIEIALKAGVDGLLACAAIGLAAQTDIYMVLCAALTYTLFVFMLVGVNYVFMRFTGANVSAGLLLMFYSLSVFIVMVPGIIAAAVTGAFYGVAPALYVLSVWELIAALICLLLSKDVLHNCDMAVLRRPGTR